MKKSGKELKTGENFVTLGIIANILKGLEMQEINSKKLAEILNSSSQVLDVVVKNISTNSREIHCGDAFLALKGEKFDAHNFALNAWENGAELLIVEHQIDDIPLERQLIVSNTAEAYGLIGLYNRSLFEGKVIGLTGSAGKTTTKEELKFALSKYGKVYATEGNYNNAVGVPLTLCNLDMSADFAIIEMGMSNKGEIEQLVGWVKPDVALVTNVYPMHIEFFNNFAEIAEAKAEIFKGLSKNGVAVWNIDTNFADILQKRAMEYTSNLLPFGKSSHPVVELGDAPEHNYYNAWAVLSVIKALGLDETKVAPVLKDFGALEGRGKHWTLKEKFGSYVLIDDSYSGQPEAMKIALKSLAKMQTSGRKIAVLGKMAELGNTSQARHIEIGQLVSQLDIDIVIGVCSEMKDMLAQLPDTIQQYYFDDKDGLDDFLINKLLQNNDIVLIKGARYSSKLYQVAESLINSGAEK